MAAQRGLNSPSIDQLLKTELANGEVLNSKYRIAYLTMKLAEILYRESNNEEYPKASDPVLSVQQAISKALDEIIAHKVKTTFSY
jgi:hypothetical protein